MCIRGRCDKGGKPMVIKWGRHGRFIACTGYPECKNTKPLPQENGGNGGTAEVQETDEVCDKCGSPMVLKSGRFGRFLACSSYPKCKTTKPLGIGVKCPEDGGELVERRSKKGKVFYSCGNYPKCKFASWYLPVNRTCPSCGASVVVEKRLKKGNFIACLKKECGFSEELQETDDDSAAS